MSSSIPQKWLKDEEGLEPVQRQAEGLDEKNGHLAAADGIARMAIQATTASAGDALGRELIDPIDERPPPGTERRRTPFPRRVAADSFPRALPSAGRRPSVRGGWVRRAVEPSATAGGNALRRELIDPIHERPAGTGHVGKDCRRACGRHIARPVPALEQEDRHLGSRGGVVGAKVAGTAASGHTVVKKGFDES